MRDELNTRYLPYPELVELTPFAERARGYEIVDSVGREDVTGAVDKVARRMLVPLEAYGRSTVRHELGHVRWSPLRPPRVQFDRRVLAAVEDARINLALAANRVPLELGPESELHVAWLLARDMKRGDALAVWLRSVAAIGTSCEPMLRTLLLSWRAGDGDLVLQRIARIRNKLEEARSERGGEVAPELRARALARELARLLRAEGVLDASGQSQSEFAIDCCTVEGHEHDEDEVGRRRWRKEADEPEGGVKPGELTITRAPLQRARSGGGAPRGWRAASEGSVVRYAHRWTADRAIFRRKARLARGTLLIDVSGSMSLKPADLDAMLASTNAGLVVAIYSGKGDKGELRVVAQGAARAADKHLAAPGGGNIVDLPALGWLARQPGPRLWISDGLVTGVGDQASKALTAQCKAVCKRARIQRVAKLADAAKVLGARG
ncbi:MAG: hypothetical protein FJ091_14230 [Deltaproteobacteria bacterium]|nr:hypothetical protein [Deltaproteobacteria bacterium]